VKYLLILIVLIFSNICQAQIVQRSSDGYYRVVDSTVADWTKTDIKVEGNFEDFSKTVTANSVTITRAIANPGESVTFETGRKLAGLELWFNQIVIVNKMTVIYNKATQVLSLSSLPSERQEEFSYSVLFVLLSIILMVLSNLLIGKLSSTYSFLALISCVISLAFFSRPQIPFPNVAFIFVALLSVIFVWIFSNRKDDKRGYIIFSVMYYLAMALGITMLYV